MVRPAQGAAFQATCWDWDLQDCVLILEKSNQAVDSIKVDASPLLFSPATTHLTAGTVLLGLASQTQI